MTGPGVFDMKAGVVQLLAAARRLDDPDGVWVLLTCDEEIGSPTARPLIAEAIAGAAAALVFEPSEDGAIKTARKGVSQYTVRISGRAAHAGLEPERGINAAVEAAHQVLAICGLADPVAGTTVTPTVLSAGTAANVVPAAASVAVDVRAATSAEQARVEAGLRGLRPAVPGAALALEPGMMVAPLEPESSRGLFALAQQAAAELGQPPLRGVSVGGGSDGNFTAAAGVPTLDGLGAVGGNAHGEGEWASLAAMPERAALAAGLIRLILRRDLDG
jgi:glutamate carboxypeptidase